MCFRPPTAAKVSEPCPKCGTPKDPIVVCPNCGFVPEIECPKCKTLNPVNAEACSNCGFKAPKRQAPPGMPPKPNMPPKAPPAPPKAPPAPPKKPGS